MSRFFRTLAFGLLLGLLGNVANRIEDVRSLEENVGLWLLFKLRGQIQPPDDAVVVAIDHESSERLNLPTNPDRWPRSLHARLIDTLHQAGARVIVFDVYFTERTSPEEDATLAAAIKRAGNVVLAEPLRSKEVVASDQSGDDGSGHLLVQSKKPIEPILSSAFGSAPFVLPRMPVRVSQYWTFQPNAGDMPTFPVMALQLYALDGYGAFRKLLQKVNPEQAAQTPPDARGAINDKGVGKFMRRVRQIVRNTPELREEFIRTNQSERSENRLRNALVHLYTSQSRPYLNFYGPAQSVASVPYYQALDIGTNEAAAAMPDVRGKAIFVGLSERELAEARDNFHTVYSKARVFLTGVEIAATAFLNLLTNTPVKPANAGEQFFVLFIWGTIIGVICRVTPPLVGGISVLLCAGAYLFAATSEFRASATWFPIVVPLFIQTPVGYLGALFWQYGKIKQERKRIMTTLGYYLPEELVTQVARDRIDIRKYGQTVYGACLFADVAGYTPVSEALSPRDLSELMHKYLEASFEPIHKNGGLIVELNGDSILAFWKGEVEESSFRYKVCAAALEMAEAVRRFNESSPAVTLPTRISIHAGPIYIGNIGAGSHYEYGITGDTVTTAARLDGLNKHLGTNILASAEVMHNLDGFLARRCGSFIMKGKMHPVEAYELICRAGDCTPRQTQGCAIFSEAQSAFEMRRWDEASEKFKQAELVFNDDELSRFYLKLGAHHRANPPAQDWNGTIVMDEK